MAPPSTLDKFPTPDMFDEIIQVMVEKAPAPTRMFSVHAQVAAFYSDYFKAAINGDLKEGKSSIIELPTEDVQVFEHFVGWLYTRVLPKGSAENDAPFRALFELWAFGDRRQIPLLMNATINTIRDEVVRTWKVPTGELHWLYQNTVPGSALRRFVVDLVSRSGGTQLLAAPEMRKTWPADAIWDVLLLVWELKEKGFQSSMSKEMAKTWQTCKYHRHEDARSDKFDSIIEVRVGQGTLGQDCEKCVYLHQGVVSFYSGYFRAAFSGSFAEATTGVVRLPTENATTFGRCVTWMYSRQLEDPEGDNYNVICELWALGDRRQIPMLMNAMVNAFATKNLRLWKAPTTELQYIYENTTPTAGLRRMAVFILSNACGPKILDNARANRTWPEDALSHDHKEGAESSRPIEQFDDSVRIEVGKGRYDAHLRSFQRRALVLLGLLRHALNGRFRESPEGTVRLPSEDPLIFELVRHWIITRRFFDSTLEPRILFDYATLAKLWVFGDAHLIPLLQNTVSHILAEKMMATATAPDNDTIDFIYENTVQDSRLRHTINQSIRYMDDPDDFYSVAMVWHGNEWETDDPENLKDVLETQKLIQASVAVQNSWLYDRCCERHIHDGVKCASGAT
ncbi:hypothetical protein LTR85_005041 [Meristemomyces frigidus]|nr:hypothetical protein LTR85_005041 [Meristemomyces frigidus]